MAHVSYDYNDDSDGNNVKNGATVFVTTLLFGNTDGIYIIEIRIKVYWSGKSLILSYIQSFIVSGQSNT